MVSPEEWGAIGFFCGASLDTLSANPLPDSEEMLHAAEEEVREIWWRHSYGSEMPKVSLGRVRKSTKPCNGHHLRALRRWNMIKRARKAESKRQKIRDELSKFKAIITKSKSDIAKIETALAELEAKNDRSADEEAGEIDLEEVRAMVASHVVRCGNQGREEDDKLGSSCSKDDQDSDSSLSEDEEEPQGWTESDVDFEDRLIEFGDRLMDHPDGLNEFGYPPDLVEEFFGN